MKKFNYFPYGYYEDEIYNIMVKYIRKYMSEYDGDADKQIVFNLLKFLLLQTLGYDNLSSIEILEGELKPCQDNGEYILCKIFETTLSLSYYGIINAMVINEYYDGYDVDVNDEDVLKIYLDFMNFIARVNQIDVNFVENDITEKFSSLERSLRTSEGVNYRS